MTRCYKPPFKAKTTDWTSVYLFSSCTLSICLSYWGTHRPHCLNCLPHLCFIHPGNRAHRAKRHFIPPAPSRLGTEPAFCYPSQFSSVYCHSQRCPKYPAKLCFIGLGGGTRGAALIHQSPGWRETQGPHTGPQGSNCPAGHLLCIPSSKRTTRHMLERKA